jgi:hypothetical protein
METEKLNKMLDDLTENEVKFCEEMEFEKNEHGVYIYQSSNGRSSMNLPFILQHYKEWLIEMELVREV